MIYFDHAATTPVDKRVLDKMLPYFADNFANPSSFYHSAAQAKNAVEQARQEVSQLINCAPRELYFTGSGTESDNWAIKACVALSGKKHIITSKIEHHAVLHTCQALEKQGITVSYLDVDEYGMVSPDSLNAALAQDTALVSIMYANNEIGTIQPIQQLAEVAHKHGVPFHTDAVQAVGSIPVDVQQLQVDFLSLSGHKFYAPKGIGALYANQKSRLSSFIHGGSQERRLRAGTENVPSIVGLGEASRLASKTLGERQSHLISLRDRLIKGVMESTPCVQLTGHAKERLPGIASFVFEAIEGEGLIWWLDISGFAVSSGSACTSASLDPSHVLLACGIPHEKAHGSLRVSLGIENTVEQVDNFVEKLQGIVGRLRSMSPLWHS